MRQCEVRLVPSGTKFDWTDAAGDGQWGTGANWYNESNHTSGAVPGPNDIAVFGTQNGSNWDDNSTVPDQTKIGALKILATYTGQLQIKDRLYVTGTDGQQLPTPLNSTIDGGAWKYVGINCVVDFQGITSGLGTQDELGAGTAPPQITAGPGDYGAVKIESAVTFAIDNTTKITAFQTEIDNNGTLNMNNTADINWVPAATGQVLINNAGGAALNFAGNGGSINLNPTTIAQEEFRVDNSGTATADATLYTLGDWLKNEAGGDFTLLSGQFSLSGHTQSQPQYSVDNYGTVDFRDGTVLNPTWDYHQGGGSSLTEYSTSGGSATLAGPPAGTRNRIDGGTLEVTGPSGVYGTFKIKNPILFANGTAVTLSVNGAAEQNDVISCSADFQVAVGANVIMNVYTDNQGPGKPGNGSTRTVITAGPMEVAPNKDPNGDTYGTITVNGGYSGGMWKGAVSGANYVLTANGDGTTPTRGAAILVSRHGDQGVRADGNTAPNDRLFRATGVPHPAAWADGPAAVEAALKAWYAPTGQSHDPIDELFAALPGTW